MDAGVQTHPPLPLASKRTNLAMPAAVAGRGRAAMAGAGIKAPVFFTGGWWAGDQLALVCAGCSVGARPPWVRGREKSEAKTRFCIPFALAPPLSFLLSHGPARPTSWATSSPTTRPCPARPYLSPPPRSTRMRRTWRSVARAASHSSPAGAGRRCGRRPGA